jgi:hypothetical protein
MIDGTRYADVVDFFWECERRRKKQQNALAEFALDECEEMFRQRDWSRFGYWHVIYRRERAKVPKR